MRRGAGEYAVKAQTSLAPLSWFPGSRIPTAHVHQCCRFQSYANSHAIPYEIYKRNLQSVNHIPGIHDNGRPVTFDFNSILCLPQILPMYLTRAKFERYLDEIQVNSGNIRAKFRQICAKIPARPFFKMLKYFVRCDLLELMYPYLNTYNLGQACKIKNWAPPPPPSRGYR